jgi:hypothetical protein
MVTRWSSHNSSSINNSVTESGVGQEMIECFKLIPQAAFKGPMLPMLKKGCHCLQLASLHHWDNPSSCIIEVLVSAGSEILFI